VRTEINVLERLVLPNGYLHSHYGSWDLEICIAIMSVSIYQAS